MISEISYIIGEEAESPGRKTSGRVWRSFRGGRGGGKEVSVGVEAPRVLMIPVGKLGHCGKNRRSFKTLREDLPEAGFHPHWPEGPGLKVRTGSPSLSWWRPAGHRLLTGSSFLPSFPPVSPVSVPDHQTRQSVGSNLHLLLFALLVLSSSEVLKVIAQLIGQLCLGHSVNILARKCVW